MFLYVSILLFVSSYAFDMISKTRNFNFLKMASNIEIYKDVDSIANRLCSLLKESAIKSIKDKGTFNFAIPGGSILKMLATGENNGVFNDDDIDWTKCTMGWVNHRAVPLNDETSTEFKASTLFLDNWKNNGMTCLSLSGSDDAIQEASRYDDLIISKDIKEWDCMLIGVGLDGHIGSIYPDSEAVSYQGMNCISVIKPNSSSISLSLQTMINTKNIIIASGGKSDKYPLGKAEGMFKALESKEETITSFPAIALREKAKWLLDENAAQLLSK